VVSFRVEPFNPERRVQRLKRIGGFLLVLPVLLAAGEARGTDVEFVKETLGNGMRVVYAPLRNAPVVQVSVMYHVGSRNERPDRQGFAHMFEHMMFRGSAHVAPEEHMRRISAIGGYSNAYTSFDETVYINTIPNTGVEMALYLEADRLASFKVDDAIFQTERKVVAEEWRMRNGNQPLGTLYQDFTRLAYSTHSYRWTPIGDMDQLRQATSAELQEFFNKYYVPNNAVLVIAGDIDVDQTKGWVRKYFGWIPRGADVSDKVPAEPEQTETRRQVVYKPNVPLTNVLMGFKTAEYRSEDHYALRLLASILSAGRTGRLDRGFVYTADPSCVSVSASDYANEDVSLFNVSAVVQQGKDPEEVEPRLLEAVYDVAKNGVTKEELEKVRTQALQALIRSRQTAEDIASELGQEELFGGDAGRVNELKGKLEAITPADIQAVAKKYLRPERLTVVHYRPDPLGTNARRAAATQAARAAAEAERTKGAPVVPSSEPVKPRVIEFPAGYPVHPPTPASAIDVTFNKGVESTVNGVRVITLTDHRLPLVNASLVMRGGGDAEPADKAGVASLTAAMLRRGSGDVPFLELSADLESRGISIEASDGGDTTSVGFSCTTDQLDYAVGKANLILSRPTFPVEEFEKLKRQTISGLRQSLASPTTVAGRELTKALYPDMPQGQLSTPETVANVTLEDVRKWYEAVYQLGGGATVVISGDVTPERGGEIAAKLLGGFERRATPPQADYTPSPVKSGRRIILVDNPEGKQATIRLGRRAYDIRSDEKFAGSLAGQILSVGINSRLNRYVRAEKGLTYGCYASFSPGRHGGRFGGSVDTNPETSAEAIEAMLKVFGDMRSAEVTPEELAESKSRTAGSMVMSMQTIAQQAGLRTEQLLNGYPIDYYDVYPRRVAQATAGDVREVMSKYVEDGEMVFVVVAPVSVRAQLERLGPVEVVPMPLNRAATRPAE
jgi:zinc protease